MNLLRLAQDLRDGYNLVLRQSMKPGHCRLDRGCSPHGPSVRMQSLGETVSVDDGRAVAVGAITMSEQNHQKAKADAWIMHYTADDRFKAIGSQKDWTFKASQPRGDNEFGAYFTTLAPDAFRLCARLKISKDKSRYVFAFSGQQGLRPKTGDKGKYVFWTSTDYVVTEASERQQYKGASEALP